MLFIWKQQRYQFQFHALTGHHQSLVSLPEEASAEVDKFKTALRKMYRKLDKAPVFFERNYRSQHLQVQVVPVHKEDAPAVKKTFLDTASRLEVDLNQVNVPPMGNVMFYYHFDK